MSSATTLLVQETVTSPVQQTQEKTLKMEKKEGFWKKVLKFLLPCCYKRFCKHGKKEDRNS